MSNSNLQDATNINTPEFKKLVKHFSYKKYQKKKFTGDGRMVLDALLHHELPISSKDIAQLKKEEAKLDKGEKTIRLLIDDEAAAPNETQRNRLTREKNKAVKKYRAQIDEVFKMTKTQEDYSDLVEKISLTHKGAARTADSIHKAKIVTADKNIVASNFSRRALNNNGFIISPDVPRETVGWAVKRQYDDEMEEVRKKLRSEQHYSTLLDRS